MSWWTKHKILRVIMYILLAFVLVNCFLIEVYPDLYPEWLRDGAFANLVITIFLLFCFSCVFLFSKKSKRRGRYDVRGFDHNHIHKNGTKYDDLGFDFYGYDAQGYNRYGYNRFGRNHKGQYDRYFDTKSCDEEGFYNPKDYPIVLSEHARERLAERLGISDLQKMNKQVTDAYRYGKSKRQIKKTSACLIEQIEDKYDNGIVLVFRNYIYIFSCENVLITVYKNDRIPL